jgi:shikimate dehydrogenase
MTGKENLEIDLKALPADAVVADIVYSPLETKLLVAARARGNQVVDGLGMLLHQAVPGFELWFGVRPEVTPALRAHVAAALGEK